MTNDHSKGIPRTTPRQSATFSQDVNSDIRRAAATGIYDIRGGGAKRKLPTFDDLLFMGASISRYPLEGYREKCDTSVTIGGLHAENPIHLDIPITIAGMSLAHSRVLPKRPWAEAHPPLALQRQQVTAA